ncbi:TonB-dependent siderophore receptor [Alcaligenes phenolicus]|uniref:TonB-dependent siderophore receptor n=1 Tax=Alcaligenes phenolicus TaxID=232846 RepID=UPI002117BDAB|nr:TonB-dependent receptor [Alcaligenes phenolicus]
MTLRSSRSHSPVGGRAARFPLAAPALKLALALALSATFVPAVSFAQQADVTVSIPSSSLGDALLQLGQQTSLQFIYTSDLVRGIKAQSVSGRMAPEAALDKLLQGSGIAYTRTGNTIHLRKKLDVEELAAIKVRASSPVTEGSGSYTAAGPSRTATGFDLSLRETPQSITVMTRERLDDFNLYKLSDVLEQTPGVSVDRQGDAFNFAIRGSAVNMQTDGMRQKASGWLINTQTQYSMDDMAEIDRIEVLKGSSGLMTGDGAYGGTVNMIRKRPTDQFQASVGAAAGSWDNYRVDADISSPLNKSGSVRGRLVAAAADGKSFQDYVKNSSKTFYGIVEADLSDRTLLTVSFTHKNRTQDGTAGTAMIQAYAADGQFLGLKPRGFNVAAPWSGYEQKTNTLFLDLTHRFENDWSATLKGSLDKTVNPGGQSGIWFTGVPAVVDMTWDRDYETRNRNLALEVQGPFNLFGRQHELRFGADTYRTTTESYAGGDRFTNVGLDYNGGGGVLPMPDFTTMPIDNHSYFSSQRNSLYAAGLFSLADPVKLIGGVRYTDFKQFDETPYSYSNNDFKQHGVLTPYAGLVVDLTDQISVYGSYASIFKAQSAKDIDGNTLDPERGLTYELGAKGEFFDGALNASVARFWMKTDNTAESTGEVRPTGETIYRAVNGATRRGYELELSGEVAPGWQLQGSYVQNSSSLQATDIVPKHQFKLASSYRFRENLPGLSVGVAARWQSKASARLMDQPSYWVFDMMARYQVNKHLSLGANVNNVFDKKYMSGLRDFGRIQYSWGAPRNFTVNMRYQF